VNAPRGGGVLGSRLGAAITRANGVDRTNPGRFVVPRKTAGTTAKRFDAQEIACGPPPPQGE
jgi:hypothetical protein